MKRLAFNIVGVVIAAYCLLCWFVLEKRNNAVTGGVLQGYHREYADGGSKRWRFGIEPDERKPLHDFITSFGVLAYPVALTGIVAFGLRLSHKEDWMFSLAILAVCFITLARFIMLGVFTAALEL